MNSADQSEDAGVREARSSALPTLPGIGEPVSKKDIVSSYHEQLNRCWQRSSHTRMTVSDAGTRLSIGCVTHQ